MNVINLIGADDAALLPAVTEGSFFSECSFTPRAKAGLRAKGYCPMRLGEIADHDAFVRDYVALIGSLSARHHGLMWWATDLASKNRVISKLHQRLQELLEIRDLIVSLKGKDTLVVHVSSGVWETLKSHFKGPGIVFEHRGGRTLQRIADKTFRFRKFCSVFYNAGLCVKRILITRWVLGGNWRSRLKGIRGAAVVKTFIYDHSFDKNGAYQDVFFGRLPAFLEKQHPVIIWGNILGDLGACLKKIKAASRTIIPLEATQSVVDVLKGVLRILTFRLTWDDPVVCRGVNVRPLIAHEWWLNYKGIQIHQLIHYDAARRLARAVDVSRYIYTCERNPWESMCLLGLREVSPSVKTIGYQHTVVPQASMNMFVDRQEVKLAPLPDDLLTVGEVNKDILERYSAFDPSRIRAACAMRFEYLQKTSLSGRRALKRFLLAIEGLYEANEMIDYVIRAFKQHPEYELRVRTHPVIPWNCFVRKFGYDVSAHANIKISDGTSLVEDLAWSDAVIYWGSTVGVEGLSLGKPIINFKVPAWVNYDPLFDLHDFKWVVTAGDDLKGVVERIDRLGSDEYVRLQQRAQQYIQRYFHPVTDENIQKFLD